MKLRLLILIVTVVAPFRAVAQQQASDCVSTNFEELHLDKLSDKVVHVRVYDNSGKQIMEPEYRYDLPKALQDKTYRRDKEFPPEQRYIATTASAGCVRGKAWRTNSKRCVARFSLPLPLGDPLDRIVVAAPGMAFDATLTVPAEIKGGVQCTMRPVIGPESAIHDVINGEEILLTVRGKTEVGWSFEVPYQVNIPALLKNGKDQPVPEALKDRLRVSPELRDKGQGRSGLSPTELILVAKKIADKVSVSK